jgi:hypothetical protein
MLNRTRTIKLQLLQVQPLSNFCPSLLTETVLPSERASGKAFLPANQEAKAKAVRDEAAAKEEYAAPVQVKSEEIDRLKQMQRLKDMERHKEMERLVSSERERLEQYPYLTAEDVRSTVSSELAGVNARKRQEFQAQEAAA